MGLEDIKNKKDDKVWDEIKEFGRERGGEREGGGREGGGGWKDREVVKIDN